MNGPVNIKVVEKVARGLKPMLEQLVFVGGAIIELYIDDPAAPPLRPTTDVDVVIEVTGYGKFAALEEEFLKLGFYHDPDSKVVCRYKYEGITVDIMPTDEEILGFSNRWYKLGMDYIFKYKLSEDIQIRLFKAPYFLASKFEAFKGRGGDRRTSHDFEDIVYFLDNRKDWFDEIKDSEREVKNYLSDEFQKLLDNKSHKEELSAHLPALNRKERVDRIITGMNEIIDELQ